ncbi:MAG TPA: pyridoxal-dependent decarboxylase [Gemmatimonadales bacterium]|nr:pyridoxal-dependent decarboxylase [Gemmatimonadales bacterium]
MDHEAFRRHGHAIVDRLADYYRDIERLRVTPDVQPGDLRRALPTSAPEQGEPFEAILADVERLILSGMTHWGHPGWFAYFPSNASPPSVLAEMLTAGIGAQCMSWITSPAATELEQVTLEWLRTLLGIPDGFTGSIQDTASSATLVAFLTARTRLGASADRMTAYWSREAHSSVAKAARLAGIPPERQRVLPVDEQFAFRPEALAEAIAADRAAGLVPGIVVATMGTTSSTACDPLRAIGTLAREAGAWYHVDAAYGGTAAICPEVRPLLDGLELADSYVTNPHKWLMVNFDCSAYYVRDVEALLATCSILPEYLRTAYDADVVNYRDWGIPLGRRFRALKLWFVLRSYGAEGLRAMIRRHIALGHELASWVDAAPEWERLAPTPLGLVCLRHVPPQLAGDEAALAAHNAALLARVNAHGDVFLTHTMLGDRYAIRVAIGQFRTERRHVEAAWRRLQEI